MLRKRSEPTAEQNAVKSIFSPTSPVQNLKTYDPQLQNTSSPPTVPTPPPQIASCVMLEKMFLTGVQGAVSPPSSNNQTRGTKL